MININHAARTAHNAVTDGLTLTPSDFDAVLLDQRERTREAQRDISELQDMIADVGLGPATGPHLIEHAVNELALSLAKELGIARARRTTDNRLRVVETFAPEHLDEWRAGYGGIPAHEPHGISDLAAETIYPTRVDDALVRDAEGDALNPGEVK